MMTKKIRQGLLLLLSVLSLSACGHKEVQEENKVFTIKGDTVHLKDKDILVDKIKIGEVETAPYTKEVVTAGTVEPIPTQFAYIAPPFSGRVVKSHVKLGQKVSANTPLFEIISPDFTAAQKEFYQARSSKELAQKDLERKKDLLKNGVGSQKELEEAQSVLQIEEKEYENAYAALKVYQVNPENMVLGQPLIIRSPINGTVIQNDIVSGQYISGEADPIATVADLSQVWITAQVKEKDIRFIHIGDNIEVEISALPGQIIEGKVFHIDESVDDETRSIKVLSICDNEDGLLKLGMYITVRFIDKPIEQIYVSEKALLQGEKNTYVYKQIAPDMFLRTPVEVEALKDGKAVISAGLNANDVIISEGGYYFK